MCVYVSDWLRLHACSRVSYVSVHYHQGVMIMAPEASVGASITLLPCLTSRLRDGTPVVLLLAVVVTLLEPSLEGADDTLGL